MTRGWVKLWRKTEDSEVFHDAAMLKVWLWCLMSARHEPGTASLRTGRGETTVELGVGEFIFGRNEAAKALRLPPSTVRNKMSRLGTMGNIEVKPDTHWSVVTVCNYMEYQADVDRQVDRQVDNQRTGKGQPKDTNKNVKNEKNEEKESTPSTPRKRVVTTPAPPVIESLRLGMGRYPAKHLWPAIEAQTNGHEIDHELLARHAAEWVANGWNKTNFVGALRYHFEQTGVITRGVTGAPARGTGLTGTLQRLMERERARDEDRGVDDRRQSIGLLPCNPKR